MIHLDQTISIQDISEVSKEIQWILFDWRNSEEISQYFLLSSITKEQHTQWLKRNEEKKSCRAFVIFGEKTPLGLAYFPHIDSDHHQGELGVYIYNRSYQQFKPAHQACRALIQMAFYQMQLNSLIAQILASNIRSSRFFSSLGFKALPRIEREIIKNGQNKTVLTYILNK